MAAKSVSHTVSLTVGDITLNFSDSITSGDTPTSYSLQTQTVSAATALTPLAYTEIDQVACNVMILLRNDEAVVTGNNSDHKNLLVNFRGGTGDYPVIVKPQTTALFSMGSNIAADDAAESVNLSDLRLKSGDGSTTVECRYMAVQTEATS